jgi:hypothetical protein
VLFVFLIVLFWSLRHWMRKTFAIEDLELVATGAASPPVEAGVTNRDWLVLMAGGVACMLAFMAMQKAIDRTMARDAQTFPAAVEEFKAALARGVSPAAAATAAGFQPADYIRLSIDKLSRNPDGQWEMAGALTDMPGDGTPMVMVMLAGGKPIFQVQAAGAAPEAFARLLALTDAAARNAGLGGAFSCRPGEPLSLVLLASSRTFYVYPMACP